MAKYRIKVIAHQLKNKVIARSGEIVDESQLMGNALDLCKANYIELVKEENDSSKEENDSSKEENDSSKEENDYSLESFSKEQLIQFANDNGFKVTETTKPKILKEIDFQLKEKEVNGEVEVTE